MHSIIGVGQQQPQYNNRLRCLLPGQTLTPDQLDDLVAPIALYPDELLSQIMVAATYPLRVVERSSGRKRIRD